ncbi:phage tail tape measure protein [Pseudomonas sp. NFPP19]|uniref:phage tail tape measure protein n=1 Tax=Pseudomonas sp. NFPP19 TaxID=1566225 RepID=UPI0008B8D499|nr:phage tail tape measure protein [Pseudomonas sp. NFPP19]SEP91368.1 phage tail tape measure protein, TP901 family, core region [Pseudomonas sp. NFPP19]
MADKFQLKALITGVDKLSPTLTGIRKNVAGFRKQMESSGLGKIGFRDLLQGGAFAAPFVAGMKAAIDFESSMADVRKVVDFDTPEQFKQMGQDVLGMSERMPMAASGIAAIVAAGGQAGFAREELKQFAEDAVKMGVAFDQTADQSGDMMAKWRTSFKMTQPEVVALADKINYLSNTGPSSAQQVADIVTRIGALGGIAGLSSGQIAAMGATLAGVGVPSEVAATGMKNFMLALTKGGAATKQQSQAFKSLRLDVKQVAKSMQQDAQGTIKDVLDRIAKVDPAKQAGLLTQLFGTESVSAIAPMLTNLDLLKTSFSAVGKEGKFAGSMQLEYETRSKTTANALQLMQNRVNRLGVEVGAALLPPLNSLLAAVGPLISQVSALAAEHPEVIKGVLGAGIAFTAMSVGVWAAVAATKVLNPLIKANPMVRIATLIAMAVGLIIANWSTIGPYFQALWEKIKGPAMVLWGWFKQAFAFTPLGLVIENWGPLTEFFKAIWGVLVAISGPAWDLIKHMFDWSPLGIIIQNWEPITAWFKGLWEKIKPIIEPILRFMGAGEGGDGIIKTATDKANAFAEEQRKRNAGEGGGTGDFLRSDAAKVMQERQSFLNKTQGGASAGDLLRAPGKVPPPGSLLQQTAAANAQSLKGQIDINLNGAPPGSTVEESKTNQRGLNIKPNVGRRTVGAER